MRNARALAGQHGSGDEPPVDKVIPDLHRLEDRLISPKCNAIATASCSEFRRFIHNQRADQRSALARSASSAIVEDDVGVKNEEFRIQHFIRGVMGSPRRWRRSVRGRSVGPGSHGTLFISDEPFMNLRRLTEEITARGHDCHDKEQPRLIGRQPIAHGDLMPPDPSASA